MNNAYPSFIAMFFALDAATEKDNSPLLLQTVTDMDPFIWEGEHSGDPSEYERYKTAFDAQFGTATGTWHPIDLRNFISKYLAGRDATLSHAFEEATTAVNWDEFLNECHRQAADHLA